MPVADVVGPILPWLLAAVAGAWCGAALGTRSAVPVAALVEGSGTTSARVGVVAAGVLLALSATWAARRASPSRRAAALVIVVAVSLGALAGARTATHHLGSLPDLAARGGSADVHLVVAAEPRPIATGWHVPVRVTSIDGRGTRERAALTLPPDALDRPPFDVGPPALGSRWWGDVTARPLPDGGYGRWLADQHLTVLLDAARLVPAGDPGWLAASSEHVRARTRAAATAHTSGSVGGLLVGLVSGDTRLLPDADRAAMEATAMTHLTAVSGMHVAAVVAGVLAVCGLVRVGARGRRLAVAVIVLWFAYLTRFQPSVLRAGTVAAVVLLAAHRGVARDGRHALAAAVLLLLLVDPLLARALGLLLSATAAAGVLVLAPRVRDRLRGWRRLPARVADVLAITVGAQVAVVPLLLVTFGEVPLASVPANLVAVPLAVVTAAVAFPASALAALHLPLGAALFAVAGVPARGILAAAHTTAGWGGVASVAAPSTVVALVVGAAWVIATPRSRTARVLAVATALACVVAAAAPVAGRYLPVRTVTVTAIDVGQGDAFLLRTPGARVLVDAGGDDSAARWLVRHGHVDLDLVVLTHGHLDHVGGATDVLARTRVGAVWRPPSPEPSPTIDAIDRAAAEAEVPVREVVRPPGEPVTATVGDVRLEVLGPPPGRPYRHAGSEVNEGSLVVRAVHDGRAALFPGDVELAAQADLLDLADRAVAAGAPDPLRVDLLAVPHHGAGTSDPDFLRRTDAPVALISVGADNTYGHPHPETLAALEASRTTVHRTDLDGTVTIEVPRPPTVEHAPERVEHAPAGGEHAPTSEGAAPTGDGPAPAGASPSSAPPLRMGLPHLATGGRRGARHRPSVACGHGLGPPHRRRRRPAAAAGARTRPRDPAGGRRRPHRRGPRRVRDRPPA